MEKPNSIKIKLEGKTFDLKFPTNGQIMAIEGLKQTMSGNTYGGLSLTGTNSAKIAQSLIDAYATFSTLIEDFRNETNIELSKLTIFDSQEIIDQYLNVYLPWYQDWLGKFNDILREKRVQDKKAKDLKPE